MQSMFGKGTRGGFFFHGFLKKKIYFDLKKKMHNGQSCFKPSDQCTCKWQRKRLDFFVPDRRHVDGEANVQWKRR
jgi:hypothetical protein